MNNKYTILTLAFLSILAIFSFGFVSAAQSAVNLGTAGDYVILAKSGISTTGTTAITGNIGVSPIASTAITGFGLIADSSNTFSTSSLITGNVYAADYTDPTPSILTTAVSDMETAYTDAAGRTETSIITELGAGDISGQTLSPGLYKWGTGLLITTDVTLSGSANSIWLFQIEGDLTFGPGAKILLSNGAQAKNVFWQVAGGVGVEIDTTAHIEGNILAAKAIHLRTGATLNGRALSQTAVTLDANAVTSSGTSSVVVPVVDNPSANVDTNVPETNYISNNQDSSSSNIDTGVGIGEDLTTQIVNKRIEYKSGNFTTSLGKFLSVREIVKGLLELRDGNIVVRTELNLTKTEGSKPKLEVNLSNGRNAEIKIMPSTASETALTQLRLKVCNESNNCTITLKEVGTGENKKVEYNIQIERHSKILGIFQKKMQVSVEVDAETGEVLGEHKPWWAFIAVEPAE